MKKRGYALPLSLCVAGVTLMLGLSAAQMTNGDLGLANHQYYQERARQAADFGLEYCVSHQVSSGEVITVPSQTGTHPNDNVRVTMFSHGQAGSPVEIPEGFEYWVAEGRSADHAGSSSLATARIGALVRYGLPAGTAGAQVSSFFVNHDGPVDFQAVDGLAHRPVLGESICSSEYNGVAEYVPFVDQTSAIQLGQIGAFGGSFRVPRGVDRGVVSYTSNTPIPVSSDGGPINVPTFTPPSGLESLGGRVLPNNFNGTLPSGRYEWLEIPADADISLKGTYHIKQLRLADGVSRGQGGTLRVASGDNAKVFVNEVRLGAGSLGLTNHNRSAQNFRFTLQAVRPDLDANGPSPVLHFKLPQGGGVALVADGHRVSLHSDSSREIRGAFSAHALQVKFAPGDGFLVRNPAFVYDVSASTARRSRTGGLGSSNGDDGPGDTGPGDTGGTGDSSSNGLEGEGEGGDGFVRNDPGDSPNSTMNSNGGSRPIVRRPAGLEPLVLSRQSL